MNIDRDGWISKRAYALWEEDGRPHGRDHHNWCRAVAEYELMMKTRASADGAEILQFRARARNGHPGDRFRPQHSATGQ
ncbi:DUF2934 domain-containing protein [Rhizobium tumorigenes]|uniref:DUF2934 domain-containing protein n=1 Tax=Rhizobium tumorigenes TaxID=2041385 RepID=UPI00241C96C5|nr:DUF2934 domain-containing protein [Rhizobium tumorigenes]WFS04232.1 DUF2934 domain-containing protein [Rhizobium tumorigenes]